MKTAIVIPARFGSTRFPGKPLALVKGKSLLYRMFAIAKQVEGIDAIYIATDDLRIKAHAESFGATVILTDSHIPNGTERVLAAVETLSSKPEVILNLQGDAILTPPFVISPLVKAMQQDPSMKLATIATRLKQEDYEQLKHAKAKGEVSGTTVVFDHKQQALYFSKSIIPYLRTPPKDGLLPIFRHIGLYAYRYDTLKHYVSLPPTPLELIEGLEQLRALEHNLPVKVILVDYQGRTHSAVDSKEDAAYAETIIDQEGELI